MNIKSIPQIDSTHFFSSFLWSLGFLITFYLTYDLLFNKLIEETEVRDRILNIEKKKLVELRTINQDISLNLNNKKEELKKKQQEYQYYKSNYAKQQFLIEKQVIDKEFDIKIRDEILSYTNMSGKPYFFSYLKI